MWPRFCYLLLLLLSFTQADSDNNVIVSSLPLVMVPLPDFSFRMTMDQRNVPADFQTHLIKVTKNHLKQYLGSSKNENNNDSNDIIVEEVALSASVAESNNPTNLLILEAVFLGGYVSVFGMGDNPTFESKIGALTRKALKSEHYWDLLHEFVEDPVLASVQILDVTFFMDTGGFDEEDDSNDDSVTMAAILAVCITILVISMALLMFMAYRQYYIGNNMNCCSSSAKSDTTYEEDDVDDDDEVDGTFVSNMAPPRVKRSSSSSSKRRRAAHAHASLSCCSTNKLEVITEEDDFTNIPLGIDREDMEETKQNTTIVI